jgi:alpha 1,2-mannosyltransferase
LTDDDVDCDMLANAKDDGTALSPASNYRVRRRAAMEKGVRAFFHGGQWSALCIDYRYEDSRTDDQRWDAKLSVARAMENPLNQTLEEIAKEVDVCYCAANDGFETRLCGEDLTEVVQWRDDPRLRGFEDAFFQEGGHLNGKGF